MALAMPMVIGAAALSYRRFSAALLMMSMLPPRPMPPKYSNLPGS